MAGFAPGFALPVDLRSMRPKVIAPRYTQVDAPQPPSVPQRPTCSVDAPQS